MSHAFLSSADRIQWFSAAPSNIYSRSRFMVSTAGHKKGYKNTMIHSRPPDYGLLTGLSIVTVHHGPEWIHSRLSNILPLFPCHMYPMNHEENGFSMSYMVCIRFTHSKDRQFLLRKPLTYNLITIAYWILSQPILWTFYTPESYIYPLGVGIYTPKTEYPWSYL